MESHLLLIDLDGTVYTHVGIIPGVIAALDNLRADGHVIRFLTNTDSKSTPGMLNSLWAKGLDVKASELFTSVTAVEALLAVCADVAVLPLTNEMVAGQLATRFPLVSPGSRDPVTHVIVGDVRESLSYSLLDSAFQALSGGASLVALQKGRFFLTGAMAHLDTGAVVAALEYAANTEAIVVGKPSGAFLRLAIESAGAHFATERIWVVGDDVTTDIRMGRSAGVTTVQVRTGKYGAQSELNGHAGPVHLIDSLALLPSLLQRVSP